MNNTNYNQYLEDQSIIKFTGWGGNFFLNKENNIVIQFLFFHSLPVGIKTSNDDKRVYLETFNFNNYRGPNPLNVIKEETLVLVNSDKPDYSMLFKIIINSESRKVKVILIELPEMGISLVTNEEKKGITIDF